MVMPTVNTMLLLMKEEIGVEQKSGGLAALKVRIVVPADATLPVVPIVIPVAQTTPQPKRYGVADHSVILHLLVHTEARFKTGIHFRFACGKMEQLI
jgi:hypothetical protein